MPPLRTPEEKDDEYDVTEVYREDVSNRRIYKVRRNPSPVLSAYLLVIPPNFSENAAK